MACDWFIQPFHKDQKYVSILNADPILEARTDQCRNMSLHFWNSADEDAVYVVPRKAEAVDEFCQCQSNAW